MKILFIIALILVFLGCESSPESSVSVNLLPLAEGNTWIYEIKNYSDSGNEKIVDDTVIASHEISLQGMPMHLLITNGKYNYFVNRNNGVWRYDSVIRKNILMFEYPSPPGKEYVAAYDTSSDDSSSTVYEVRGSVISANELVTTEAGTFSCYHYRIETETVYFLALSSPFGGTSVTNTESVIELYFSPGIGIVKEVVPRSIYNGYPNGYKETTVLKSYSLK